MGAKAAGVAIPHFNVELPKRPIVAELGKIGTKILTEYHCLYQFHNLTVHNEAARTNTDMACGFG